MIRALFLILCFWCVPASAQELRLGDGSGILLEAWGNVDRSTEHLKVTDASGKGAARFHATEKDSGLNWGAAMAARVEGAGGDGVGSFHYGEVTTGTTGNAWGANALAATYSGKGVAHGIEINGLNRSGILPRRFQTDTSRPFVTGTYIVNGGNAPTNAGIYMETSASEPTGVPYVGINLVAQPAGPDVASDTGIRVGRVTSGEAINVQGQKVALSEDGRVYLIHNPETDKVEIWVHGVLKAAF